MKSQLFVNFLTLYCLTAFGFSQDLAGLDPDPDVTPLSPQDSLKTIRVMDPFQIELIAAEPLVNEPVCMAWGGDGALYVVELLGYMQDIDHTGAQEPIGRVVRLTDTNGDGVMDESTVFVDKLVEPRAVMAVADGILVGSPPDLFFCKDTDGDGNADVQKSISENFATRSGNVEHKTNGLMWGIDNWIYNAKTAKRFQYTIGDEGGKVEESSTGFRGQWGITQDNIGNIYASTNSAPWIGEQIAYEYLMHNQLVHNETFSRLSKSESDFNTVWPLIGTPDVQSGPGILRQDKSLSRFTAIGGNAIFRGDRLGQDMVGQYIIPEPVGRLVRRSTIEEENGFRKLVNPTSEGQVEFIASKDPNFRPVNAYTGPDGCLYIVDMYRGIIQDGNWTRPGSYLRDEILRKGLEKNIQRGRIYRVSKKGVTPGSVPKFDTFSSVQLLKALAHPNGWWRDEAQKRLVLAQDQSVVPKLKEMLEKESTALGRVHAIWTLHGLSAWTQSLATAALQDSDWRVQFSAIRASESIMQSNLEFIKQLDSFEIPDLKIAKQLILSLGLCNTTKDVSEENRMAASRLIKKTALLYPETEVIILSTIASMPGQEDDLLTTILNQKEGFDAKGWLKVLSQMIVKSGDAKRLEGLFDAVAGASNPDKRSVIKGLVDALPKSGRLELARFDSKPEGLAQLEAFAAKSENTEVSMKRAMNWFTWPGEARYDKPHAIAEMTGWERNLYNRGKTIYAGLCVACHGQEGMGVKGAEGQPILAPPLAGSKRIEGDHEPLVKVLLHGMVGPIEGKTYSGLMAPMGANDDEWISSVLTYIRREWGNVGGSVPDHQVARIREKNKDRTTPWTDEELIGKKKNASKTTKQAKEAR